jgi:type IV pilus biogenesis protein CpaD/CtpE
MILLGAGLVGGCATTPSTTTNATASATMTDAPMSQPVDITELANHGTVRLRIGQVVQLSLPSTYWSDPVSSMTNIVANDGPVSRVASGRCPIGGGCGTVSARFRAVSAGTAQLRAQRSSCGEALPCRPSQRQFTVTILAS